MEEGSRELVLVRGRKRRPLPHKARGVRDRSWWVLGNMVAPSWRRMGSGRSILLGEGMDKPLGSWEDKMPQLGKDIHRQDWMTRRITRSRQCSPRILGRNLNHCDIIGNNGTSSDDKCVSTFSHFLLVWRAGCGWISVIIAPINLLGRILGLFRNVVGSGWRFGVAIIQQVLKLILSRGLASSARLIR